MADRMNRSATTDQEKFDTVVRDIEDAVADACAFEIEEDPAFLEKIRKGNEDLNADRTISLGELRRRIAAA